jgi:hypothetical protein
MVTPDGTASPNLQYGVPGIQEWPKEPIPTRRIRDLVRAHDSGFAVWSTGHNGWLISSEGGGFLTGFC